MGRHVREMAYLVVDLLRSCVILSASLIGSPMVNDLLNKERERRQILRLHKKTSSAPSMSFYMCGLSLPFERRNLKQQESIRQPRLARDIAGTDSSTIE